MAGLLLYIFVAFLSLIFVFLVAVALPRKSHKEYKTSRNYRPRVLVILPCKGTDLTIAQNIESLKHQSYTNYDIIGVVYSKRDKALGFLRAAKINVLFTNRSYTRCSGKVASIATAIGRLKRYDAYVIADSDITAPNDWLAKLIAPLADKTIGISTTFPYFNPIQGFWSRVKMVWGFVGQSLMESSKTRFGWGGSLAFRKELMGKKELAYFKTAISDDMAITKIAKSERLGIAYVKSAMPTINTKESLQTFSEWANRQTALFAAASRPTAYYGIAFYALSLLLFVSSIALAIAVSPIFLLFLVPTALSIARCYNRARRKSLDVAFIYFVVQIVYLANLLKATRMRFIIWRGRKYPVQRLQSPFVG